MLIPTLLTLLSILGLSGELDELPLLDGGIKRIGSHDLKEGDNDFLPLLRGDTLVLADIKGPGTIKRLYLKVDSDDPAHLRSMLLRFFWDGAEQPSVECPLGDFFGLGHARYYAMKSVPLVTGNKRGLTSYFPMPFRKSALLLLVDQGSGVESRVFFQIDYEEGEPPEEAGLFHASYSQGYLFPGGGNHLVLHAEGQGKYVGLVVSMVLGEDGWFGQGDERIYVDGSEAPAVQGTGLDDLFGGAFGFENRYCGPYFGTPVVEDYVKGAEFTGYRFLLRDPIVFSRSIDVLLEHLGERFDGELPLGADQSRRDAYFTVAYWYQSKPGRVFAVMPAAADRLSGRRLHTVEGEDMPMEKETRERIEYLSIYGETVVRFSPLSVGDAAVFHVRLPENAVYEVSGFFTRSSQQGSFRVSVNDQVLTEGVDFYKGEGGQGRYRVQRSDRIFFKKVKLEAGLNRLVFEALEPNVDSLGMYLDIDAMVFEPAAKPAR